MESLPLPPSPQTQERPWPGVILTAAAAIAVAAFVWYGLLLGRHVYACAGGSDSSGYFNQARLLASGRTHTPFRVLPGIEPSKIPNALYVYAPLGFKPAPDGNGMVPTYPTGLPLLIAALAPFWGWGHACDAALVILALLGVLLTYGLGRAARLPRLWAALGAVIVAASPLYLEYAVQAMSDLPALAWTAAAVLSAWKARERPLCALASGASLALAVLVRPNNLIALAPIACAFLGKDGAPAGVNAEKPRKRLALNLSLFVLGGIPGAAFFCLYNKAAYGAPFDTGYGDPWNSFSLRNVLPTLPHFVHWLPLLFTPVIGCALGLPWLLLARRAEGRPDARAAAVLGTWALAYLALYAAYEYTRETWWYLRFVLPGMPALVVGGLLVLHRALRGFWERIREAWGPLIAGIAACLIFLLAGRWVIRSDRPLTDQFDVLDAGQGEAAYPLTAAWLKDHVPSDAVVLVMQESGSVFYYTDFTIIRWDQLDPALYRRVLAAARAAHRPVYAALAPFETAQSIRDRTPGTWTEIGAVRDVAIWRRAAD